MLSGFDIFVIAFVVLAILTLLAGVKTVAQGYSWTVERFGRYTRTLKPGLNFIVPYFDRIGRKMNMMEQAIDIPQQDVISKDNASVTGRWYCILSSLRCRQGKLRDLLSRPGHRQTDHDQYPLRHGRNGP